MALYGKLQKSDDDDEDLEALRLAALQTLRSNKSSTNNSSNSSNTLHQQQQISSFPGRGRGRGFRGGMLRSRPGRNPIFQRHQLNSNLIAIVPMSNDPPPGSDNSQNQKTGRGRGMVGASNTGPKLGLPQHRYCKVESNQENKGDEPTVSTKFSRYDDSNSDSSADESEDGNETSDKVSVGSGVAAEEDNDPDVLNMAADDEEDSLEKLMDELEQEMNKSDSNAPVKNSVKSNPDPQKHMKTTAKSKRNICDTSKSQKNQESVSSSKVVPVLSNSGNQKVKESSQNSSSDYTKDITVSVPPSHVSSSSNSKHHKDNFLHERDHSAKSIPQNSRLSPKAVSTSQRQLSPVSGRKSRSRSPQSCSTSLLKSRRSRSPSPRSKFSYSPVRNRIPRSPRSRMSRSPVHLARSRSRSPMRSLRSPRKRYSRSPPPWHQPSSNHSSRFSPQRQSPRARRPVSPRQSPSRSNRISPRRSPDSRWWSSPRRSVSPQLRRSSLSPPSRHIMSPRARRTSVSPRRPLSPLRRRLSPSPTRRNPSPPRRFSPPRRNPSPPRGRYSRSLSRSPERFVTRGRSPLGGRLLHHGSAVSPKRRSSRSPSLRRRPSRSPFNRLPPRHSPIGRKLSPWSPPRQPLNQRTSPAARRYSASPRSKQRSPSPYGRQRRRSNSPNRRPPVNRLAPRTQRSPARDLRRPLQESRMNNIRPRSRSPLLPSRLHLDPGVHHNRSPRHSQSPLHRSRSHTSSISLSPSPERGTVNNIHRYKSPLRLHGAEYRNSTLPVIHSSKEGSSGRQRNIPSPISGPGKKPSKTRSSKRKEPRNRAQKRDRSKEDTKKESDRRSKEDLQNMGGDKIPVLDSTVKNTVESSDSGSNLALMEARRRKFESTGPVKPDGKKISLKTTQLQHQQQKEERENKVTQRTPQKHSLEEKGAESTALDDSGLLETVEDLDFDEPYLELQSADLWSSEESDPDNEARFKSGARIQVAGSGKVGVVPFTKLLGQTKPPVHKQEEKAVLTRHKKSSSSSRKISSGDSVNEDAKGKQGLEVQRSRVGDSQEVKKIAGKRRQCEKEKQDVAKLEGTAIVSNVMSSEVESKLEAAGEGNNDTGAELVARSRDGDLRAELSRRRAERLTKAGSLHESLPARLLQSAFEGVVGKKGVKRTEKEEKQIGGKGIESKKEKSDVRRVLVLKRPTVTERRVASFSVTIPKESKHELDTDSPPAKLPIRMRLGLPAAGSPSEDRLLPRRRNRKVKLKRNVTLGSRPDDKV